MCRSRGPCGIGNSTPSGPELPVRWYEGIVAQFGDRLTYTVEKRIDDRDEAAVVCAAVFEVLGPALGWAVVDAYSDYRDHLPAEVDKAQHSLRELGARQHGGDAGMGVQIWRGSPEWDLVAAYAPWSIHVELRAKNGRCLATLHDCGFAVTAELTADEAATLRQRVSEVSRLVLLSEFRERQREERVAARRRRLHAVVDRLRCWSS